ncbi:uncharacterized protein LOC111305395 [Durio zibethinus]|uniref:Uncharacterized protein LOC111305395 n=1 Tax=Durio zibethinus TaxID=66656 RepID=A0A6P6A0X3_DURZI|nr:uncharacterized protein LOC111305395 [Durio zibethinus]
MAKYAASPSCIKLHLHQSFVKQRGFVLRNSNLRTPQSKFSFGSCKVFWLSTWRNWKVDNPFFSNFNFSPCFRETSLRSTCIRSLLDSDGIIASDWIPVGDQLLLMGSIFLTYLAGVIPVQKSSSTSQKNIADDDAFPKSSTSSGKVVVMTKACLLYKGIPYWKIW